MLDAQIGYREEIGNKEGYLRKPIEEKKSYGWLEELREVNELGKIYSEKEFVMLANREADILEILSEERPRNVNYVIRGHHDRRIQGKDKFDLLRFIR